MSCYCSCATGGRCPSCFELVRPSRCVAAVIPELRLCGLQGERAAHAAQMGALREGDPEPESTGGQADDAQGRGGEGGVEAFCGKYLNVM